MLYVGLTRARKRLRLSLAQNRRIHGLWQSAIPSRFLDELPAAVVEVKDTGSSYGGYTYGGRAGGRFDLRDPFESGYETPGWQRAKAQQGAAASDVLAAGQLPMLTLRLAKLAGEFLTPTGLTAHAAAKFDQDLTTYGEIA